MNQILLSKVFPTTLTASGIVLLFYASEAAGPWFWIIFGVLSALDGIFFIWMKLRKAPNLKIMDDAVLVCGLRIDRHDIQAWRIFRSAGNGERGRYIEIQLKRIPPSPFGWKLAKLFEQVPTSRRFDRGGRLAREPRIIASLNSWDLTNDEISNALDNSEVVSPNG
jgi:hypothetical protein